MNTQHEQYTNTWICHLDFFLFLFTFFFKFGKKEHLCWGIQYVYIKRNGAFISINMAYKTYRTIGYWYYASSLVMTLTPFFFKIHTTVITSEPQWITARRWMHRWIHSICYLMSFTSTLWQFLFNISNFLTVWVWCTYETRDLYKWIN